MLVHKPMMLLCCVALGAIACENKDTTKTEPNPAVPEQPVTITNAPVAPTAQPIPAVAPVVVNPIANATNATEVTQFPDQTKVAPSQAKVTTATATVRPAPQSADKVQVVKQGLEVTELAKDKDYYLVLFNDSSDAAKQKAGWIHKDSLETYATERADKNSKEPLTGPSAAKAAPAASKLTCNTGEVRLQTDHDFCAHQCKDDSDCKKLSGVCDGAGKMVSLAGQMTPAHYCVMNSVPGSMGVTNTPSTNAPNDPATKVTAPTTR